MTTDVEVIPELKQILGALLFASKDPLSANELRKVIVEVAEKKSGPYKDFAQIKDADIKEALAMLKADLETHHVGVHLSEVAKGYRLQNDVNCGLFLRHMLDRGRANRLTKPALETLAIIAYRQPVNRAEIEAVRGVAVDQILRNLIDLQLIKITGRSELPGRPWLFGTTHKFLEYFGLRDVKDLPSADELKRVEAEQRKKGRNEAIAPASEDASNPDDVEAALGPAKDEPVEEAPAGEADEVEPKAEGAEEDPDAAVENEDDAADASGDDDADSDNEDDSEDEDEDDEDDDDEDDEEYDDDEFEDDDDDDEGDDEDEDDEEVGDDEQRE